MIRDRIHQCMAVVVLVILPILTAQGESSRAITVDQELQERWKDYWMDRYGGFSDDHGALATAVVTERIAEDLEQMVEMQLAGRSAPLVVERLQDYPEHLALDQSVREWIRILGQVYADGDFHEIINPTRRVRPAYAGTWFGLTSWWVNTVGPQLPPDKFRQSLLAAVQKKTTFPLHPGVHQTFTYLGELVTDKDRKQLYDLLLNERIRNAYIVVWWRLYHNNPALRPRREELAQLLESNEFRYRSWAIQRFAGMFPDDRRGQEAALQEMASPDYMARHDIREPLRSYFGSSINSERKQEMFDRYIKLLEKDRNESISLLEQYKVVRILTMHFIRFPEEVLRQDPDNIDRVIALFEWADGLKERIPDLQGGVSMESVEDRLKRLTEIKRSMTDAE